MKRLCLLCLLALVLMGCRTTLHRVASTNFVANTPTMPGEFIQPWTGALPEQATIGPFTIPFKPGFRRALFLRDPMGNTTLHYYPTKFPGETKEGFPGIPHLISATWSPDGKSAGVSIRH